MNGSTRVTAILAVSLLALALSACKSEEAATPAASSEWPSFDAPAAAPKAAVTPLPRACTLLSAEQAQAVLQLEAGLMVDEAESCMWSGSAGVGNLSMLTLTVVQNDDVAMAETVFDGVLSSQGNLASLINQQVGEKTKKSGQELEGLGDAAWLSSASYGESIGPHQVAAQQLAVRLGTQVMAINVTGVKKSEGLGERMEALARAAVAQLETAR
jgi:hypothetical protein